MFPALGHTHALWLDRQLRFKALETDSYSGHNSFLVADADSFLSLVGIICPLQTDLWECWQKIPRYRCRFLPDETTSVIISTPMATRRESQTSRESSCKDWRTCVYFGQEYVSKRSPIRFVFGSMQTRCCVTSNLQLGGQNDAECAVQACQYGLGKHSFAEMLKAAMR